MMIQSYKNTSGKNWTLTKKKENSFDELFEVFTGALNESTRKILKKMVMDSPMKEIGN